jgi:hypothetical protein
MSNLKPCPFCWSSAPDVHEDGIDMDCQYWVLCANCSMSGPTSIFSTTARAAWNALPRSEEVITTYNLPAEEPIDHPINAAAADHAINSVIKEVITTYKLSAGALEMVNSAIESRVKDCELAGCYIAEGEPLEDAWSDLRSLIKEPLSAGALEMIRRAMFVAQDEGQIDDHAPEIKEVYLWLENSELEYES